MERRRADRARRAPHARRRGELDAHPRLGRPGYSTIHSAAVLAGRAKRAGMKALLDLHYSDFWADPAHEAIPAAWVGQAFPQLTETVRRYTRHTGEHAVRGRCARRHGAGR